MNKTLEFVEPDGTKYNKLAYSTILQKRNWVQLVISNLLKLALLLVFIYLLYRLDKVNFFSTIMYK